MKNFFGNFIGLIKRNKIKTLIIICVVGLAGYYGWQRFFPAVTPVRYVTSKVERGALVSSITGTGQVSASNQVDIKAKASGDIIAVSAVVGQEVKSGALLASLNARDALKSVRDAQANLDSAKISLAKLTEATDPLTLLQAENSLIQAQESQRQTEDNLAKAYEDGFNTVADSFLKLPGIMSDFYSILYGNDYDNGIPNLEYYANDAKTFESTALADKYKNAAALSYSAAKNAYDINYNNYKSANRFSDTSTIENLIDQTYDTTRLIADAIKDAINLIQYYSDTLTDSQKRVQPLAATHLSSLNSYTGTTNSQLISLLNQKSTIKSDRESITSADRSIAEKTASLADLKAGVDALDLKSQQLSVTQRENALSDARETLANYSVRAPFDGVVAAFTAKKGDSISSGSSLGTLITKQRIATIALNEIDVAKVKTGQKATITFDAIDGLNITGEVIEVDAIGTVSQGVVSYNVKVAFDVQDDRVKPGMSVTVVIILSSKPGVLMVPTAAIKIQNGASYVQVMASSTPQNTTVTVGDFNDTMTEITAGLNEGDEIVTQTVSGGTTAAATTGQSATRVPSAGMIFGGPRD